MEETPEKIFNLVNLYKQYAHNYKPYCYNVLYSNNTRKIIHCNSLYSDYLLILFILQKKEKVTLLKFSF